jgi:hypothetical protein
VVLQSTPDERIYELRAQVDANARLIRDREIRVAELEDENRGLKDALKSPPPLPAPRPVKPKRSCLAEFFRLAE